MRYVYKELYYLRTYMISTMFNMADLNLFHI